MYIIVVQPVSYKLKTLESLQPLSYTTVDSQILFSNRVYLLTVIYVKIFITSTIITPAYIWKRPFFYHVSNFPPPIFFHHPPSAFLSTFSIFHYYTIHFRCLFTPVSFYQLFFYTRHIYTQIFLLESVVNQ